MVMATFRSVEEIDAWRKARELVKKVYAITKKSAFSKDYGLRDQIRRASISTMSNIAEGHERDGTREFIQFLSVAKGSTGEVKSHLYAALDQGYITQTEFEILSALAAETGSMIAGLMVYLKQSGLKGMKYS